METRNTQHRRPTCIRSADGKRGITGYAAVFYRADDPGTEYELARYGNYSVVERLMPGCFDRAIKEDDVRALFNHDASAILGRVRAGTLRLSIDNVGLRYEIDAPDTTVAHDLMESLQRGDVSGSSFSFDYRAKSVVQQSNADGSEQDIIEVREAQLYDVGPVTFPAYSSTTSGLRAHRGSRCSPAGMLLRADRIDQELADLHEHIRGSAPSSRRSRRRRMRDRANAVAAQAEHDALEDLVIQARREKDAGLLRRRA